MDRLAAFRDSERFFRCPVCGHDLRLDEGSLRCDNGHCFDVARSGYVNLAPRARPSHHYTKESFAQRMAILAQGCYAHVADELERTLDGLAHVGTVLDAGCGEGFYARRLSERPGRDVLAFDISKDSVLMASRHDPGHAVRWFVGDLTEIPVRSGAIDCVVDVFSPANYREFARVLTPGGLVVKVVPASDHLREIREVAKAQLRSATYSNERVVRRFAACHEVLDRTRTTATRAVTPEVVTAFAQMTPLLFSVDAATIDLADVREVTIDAEVLVGRPHAGA